MEPKAGGALNPVGAPPKLAAAEKDKINTTTKIGARDLIINQVSVGEIRF
jgi:hypothetical protein